MQAIESLHDMGPDRLTSYLQAQRDEAEKTLLQLAPKSPDSIRYEKLWPQVLARHVIKLADVNKMAANMRGGNQLLFPDWEKGKRVPQSHYRTQRP